ncbi:hypothetical protein M9H77_04897 [Catharanthus roseus]|uniref:Uncharacterized protein n=1 Tax=Catharanthus roseus TaxID=4058 RepID=A0ACC0CFU9_CATRO|nr:hypothetical protein M9H77_04897 [Catharanthus roseus]
MESIWEVFKSVTGERLSGRWQNKSYRKLLIIIIFFSFFILFTFITAKIIVPLGSGTESIDENSERFRLFCSVTQHPDSCFNSISSIITTHNPYKETGPDEFFVAYIKLAIDNISSLDSLDQSIISNSEESRTESVLKNCTSSWSESVSLLNKSLAMLGKETTWIFTWLVDHGIPLTFDENRDLMMWLGGSFSKLAKCFIDLSLIKVEVESTALDELTTKVYEATVDVSNIVDIFLKKEAIFRKFHPSPNNYSRVEFKDI